MIVPPWTDSWERLERRVLSTLRIDGRFAGAGSFRSVPRRPGGRTVWFQDFIWTVPDVVLTRPEGKAFVNYRRTYHKPKLLRQS